MSDRTQRSRGQECVRSEKPSRLVPGAIVMLQALGLILATLGPARGASVFMKNGYIIQGPVVERDEQTLVLGWPNGKVFLAKRFVESVSYDPGEEKRLEEEERLRRERQAHGVETEDLPVVANDSAELPSTLDELMRNFNLSGRGSADTVAPRPSGAATTSEPTGAAPVDPLLVEPADSPPADAASAAAVVVTRPEDPLGDRIDDPARGISLRPPRSWEVRAAEKALTISGPASTDGFRPSMNVIVLAKGALSALDYGALLRQENAGRIDSYESIHEGYRDVGSTKGLQVVGRGTYKGRTAVVRQILVADADQVWLVSTFTEGQSSEVGSFALTEESVKTLEFTHP